MIMRVTVLALATLGKATRIGLALLVTHHPSHPLDKTIAIVLLKRHSFICQVAKPMTQLFKPN
jgi:hypothetical protein